LQKLYVEKILQKYRQKFACHLFHDLFVLSRFWLFLGDGSSKTQQKTFDKKIVSKSLQKNGQKKPEPNFPRFFLIAFRGASRRGESIESIRLPHFLASDMPAADTRGFAASSAARSLS
jgi:hypothetical protein